MNSARARAYLQMLVVVVIWGIAPSVIKFALNELPPFLFLFYRFLITVIFFTPFYLMSGNKGLKPGNIISVILASFFASTATLGLLFYGTNLTTSLDSSLISATSPIIIILAGALFLKERITKSEKLGIFITIIGTFIIATQAFFEATGTAVTRSILGNVLIFASNLTFAASVFLSKSALRKGVSAFSLMYVMFLVGLITVIPLTIKEGAGSTGTFLQQILALPASAHLSVWYMAFLSGALAYYLYQKAQKTIETSEAAVFLYLQPLITAPVGVLWLHEKITLPFIAGSVVIAFGVILAEMKKKRR